MKHTKRRFLSILLALVMVIGLVPASVFAAEPESTALADGTYEVGSISCPNLSMWKIDNEDFTSKVIIKDGKATLVTRSYTANRWDALWLGTHDTRPED